ncbi:hypothetical protein KH5_03070 [Urechidicola sp. KH5]
MIKKLTFLSIIFFSIVSSSQTKTEKDIIISSYDKDAILQLKQDLKEKNTLLEEEIKTYLEHNLRVKRSFTSNGVYYSLKAIINDKPVFIATANAGSAQATRTDFLQPSGTLNLNLEGENMHVATWDGGPTLVTHQEFTGYGAESSQSRVNTPDSSASNDQSNHSTHVSGTIIAKGVISQAKGMAPKATLTSFDWDNDDLEALDEATNNGLLLSNHSYGVPVLNNSGQQNAPTWMMGCYNSDARLWDDIMYNAPYYLMVSSAGNSGNDSYTGGLAPNYDKLTTFSNAKNNLVIANANNPVINPNGSGDLLSLFINSSSSQGPSDDGRIKPDITGDGTSVYSPITGTNNTSYATYTGTSMSAPNVTGSLLLLQEYYNNLNSSYMRSATLKALAIHTADDDNLITGPDAIFGWGLLNSKAAAELITSEFNNGDVILESTLNNGGNFSFNVEVTTASEPLVCTVVWTDPPGTDQSGSTNSSIAALVNDLDLRITKDTDTFFPWKLDRNNVSGFATTGDNTVDNVEKIEISFPSSGQYTVTISHKGSTLTDDEQKFSLILSGADSNSLSVGDNELTGYSIWPNPAGDRVFFSMEESSSKPISISVYDMQGRTFINRSLDSNENKSIDTSILASGVYFVKLEQGNKVGTEKIIIR